MRLKTSILSTPDWSTLWQEPGPIFMASINAHVAGGNKQRIDFLNIQTKGYLSNSGCMIQVGIDYSI
jgi:hypothetical protein